MNDLNQSDKSCSVDGDSGLMFKLSEIASRSNKKSLKKLCEDESYRLLAENVTDVVFVQDMDLNVIYASPSVTSMFRCSIEEALNTKPKDFMTPESLERANKEFRKYAALAEENRDIDIPLMQYKYIRMDGTTFWGELKVTFLRDSQGNLIGVQGVLRDIDKRKKAEESIRKARDELQMVCNLTGDIIVKVDDQSRWTFANEVARKFWGKSREELLGESFEDYIHPEDYEHTMESIERAKNGETIKGVVNRQKTPRGWRTVEWNVAGVYGSEEEYIGLQATGRDITEHRDLEGRISQLNEILRLLNKMLRHDILNNLTVVDNSLDMYERYGDKNILNNASSSIEKGIKLIKEVGTLESLVSSGGGLKPCRARKIIEESIASYIPVNVEGDCTVIVDNALSSIIDNLINNAVKHGNASKIDIKIESRGDFCEIRVADDGQGIADVLKEKVFEEGFSGNEGTGLGLYITRKTIERYGGSIHVEDNHPQGSVFVLRLICSN